MKETTFFLVASIFTTLSNFDIEKIQGFINNPFSIMTLTRIIVVPVASEQVFLDLYQKLHFLGPFVLI